MLGGRPPLLEALRDRAAAIPTVGETVSFAVFASSSAVTAQATRTRHRVLAHLPRNDTNPHQ